MNLLRIINYFPWLVLLTVAIIAGGVVFVALNLSDREVVEYPLVPTISSQSITETGIVIFGYIASAFGLILAYKAATKIVDPRKSSMLLFAGIGLFVISILLLGTLYSIKLP